MCVRVLVCEKDLGVAVMLKVLYTFCETELSVCESFRERNKESREVTLKLYDGCIPL